jgi:hypothetical protein
VEATGKRDVLLHTLPIILITFSLHPSFKKEGRTGTAWEPSLLPTTISLIQRLLML